MFSLLFPGVVVCSAVLLACTAPRATKPSVPNAPVSSISASSEPEASASNAAAEAQATSGAPLLLHEIPSEASPELRKRLEFLAGVCPVALRSQTPSPTAEQPVSPAAQEPVAGCRVCPPFDVPGNQPDGHIALDPESFFPLDFLLYGSFSRPGAQEAMAVFTGCEPHSENWGGTLLAERSQGEFRALRYSSGLHPTSCQVFRRPDARDIVVCEYWDAHQSISSGTLFSYDFVTDRYEPLLSISNVFGCLAEPGTRTVNEEQIESVTLPVAVEGRTLGTDLVVVITRTLFTLDASYAAYCERVFASETPLPPPAGQRETFTSVFHFDGTQFVATKTNPAPR